jgi:hypothetical protein
MDLQQFYNSKAKDELVIFIDNELRKYASQMVLERKDVSGIADAKDIIDKVFFELKKQFAPKVQREVINEAE